MNFSEFEKEKSTWSKQELINALWTHVSHENHVQDASSKVIEARDFLMGADPDDPQNFERLFEILGYQKNGL